MRRIDFTKSINYLSAASIIVLVTVFASINPNFISGANIKNILSDVAPILVMSIGVTFVLLIGSVDLSVGAICSCACVMTGTWFAWLGNGIIPLVLLYGLLAGALNGLIFTRLKIPSFIVTLSTMSLWKCAALLISKGAPQGIPLELWPSLRWVKYSFAVIPIVFAIGLAVLGVYYIIQRQTVFGKSVFAVGANERAARMIGLDVLNTKVLAFMLSGLGSALSGVFFALILKSSLPTIGDQLVLVAMAAVVLGGTALTGGRGSVLKTLLGVVLVLVIQNGLNVIAVDAFWQQIVFGTLVVFAVYLNAEKGGKGIIVK
ncbi:ribose transporter permease rbsC [candidate division KSB3 bacterium]|uniref:Ribose transporter permease rbsC n=1 Tax=candidate division KSB3 bacterium TaxID=2044937 RepID=A0A2G6E9W9_9BACT|nr:MAG: ribose transporter permease rbsC [candidate division KSB3 bacterium]